MQLSPNFSLDSLTRSQTALRKGIDNKPPQQAIDNLTLLCSTLLEPARALLGVPLMVDSGFRCQALNEAVGGASTSEHLFGRAADLVPEGMDLREAFDKLRSSALPYDQIITECNAWIHLGMAAEGVTPRRQAMSAMGSAGHWTYSPVQS
jgi:hypothetical protein